MNPNILHFAIRFTALYRKAVACGCCHAVLEAPVPGPLWLYLDTPAGPRPCCMQCAQEYVPFLLEVLRSAGSVDGGVRAHGWNRTRPNHIPISEFALQGEPVPPPEEITSPFDTVEVRDVLPGELPAATGADDGDDDEDEWEDDLEEEKQ